MQWHVDKEVLIEADHTAVLCLKSLDRIAGFAGSIDTTELLDTESRSSCYPVQSFFDTKCINAADKTPPMILNHVGSESLIWSESWKMP